MKTNTFILCLFVSIAFFIISKDIYAQIPGKDILKENYTIGESSELFTIRTQDDTVEFRIFDSDGNINENGIVEKEKVLILDNEWQTLSEGSPVRILSGYFNSDRYTDVVAAWQSRDSNIILYIPKIHPVTLKVTSDYKIHLTELGMPEYYVGQLALARMLSLKKGQLDNDPQEEIVLAYMADWDETEGGPVWIAVLIWMKQQVIRY
ncbi:MAG: hypothetical protein HC906_07055 [Bacteroidales bacterium]|nr:hypothetical protein [Bacteroidales bacterium]